MFVSCEPAKMSLFFGIDWLKGGYLKKYGKDISREQFELLWEINREESLGALPVC